MQKFKMSKFLLNPKTLQLSPQPIFNGILREEFIPPGAIALTDEQYLYFTKEEDKALALKNILENKFRAGNMTASEQKQLFSQRNNQQKEVIEEDGASVSSFEPWSNQKISRASRDNLLKYATETLGIPDVKGDEEIEVLRIMVKDFQEKITNPDLN